MSIVQEVCGVFFLAGAGLIVGLIIGKSVTKEGAPDAGAVPVWLFCALLGAAGFVWAGLSWGGI